MKSMTGYGAAEGRVGEGRVFVEIKSVNHRYKDLQIKIPPKMNPLDPLIRVLLGRHIERGKIDFFMKERKDIALPSSLSVNMALAKRYQQCLKKLCETLGEHKKEIHLLEVVDIHDLVAIEDLGVDYAKYWHPIQQIVLQAVRKLDEMRSREGQFVMKDQQIRLKKLSSLVEQILSRSAKSVERHQQRIKSRLVKGVDRETLPKEKVAMEAATLAEKLDIAEELTRLKSHIQQYQQILRQNGAQGRRLDFLMQEMNREVNTLGAKSFDALISRHVVEFKSELEKLREQAQNIE